MCVLWMADNYKITAVISDTLAAEDKRGRAVRRRLELEALTSTGWGGYEYREMGRIRMTAETGLAAAGTEDGDSRWGRRFLHDHDDDHHHDDPLAERNNRRTAAG